MISSNRYGALQRQALGGTYTPAKWGKRKWWARRVLLQPETWQFGLHDQLMAIQALGSSQRHEALSWLRWLIETESDVEFCGATYDEHGIAYAVAAQEHVSYPNVTGELRAALDYTVSEECQACPAVVPDNYEPQPVDETVHQESRAANRVYQIVIAAIHQLEQQVSVVPEWR